MSQTKICQNCGKEFTIEPEDFEFYERIKVPAPTFCPKCRLQRRLAFFNLTNLYKRRCDLCQKEVISMYAPEVPYQVYCPHCWWSDDWDPFRYGREYDFSKNFFEQFNELWHEVPLLGLSLDLPTTLTSPYNNHAGHLKNCYLLFHADFIEDSAYGMVNFRSKSVFDCSLTELSELCYDCIHAFKDNRGIGLNHVTESLDCAFLRNCGNCQDCFACANLRNKKYFIFNKPYTKEEYFEEIKKWDLGSYRIYKKVEKLAKEHWKKFPPDPRLDKFSVNVTGNYVFESKNCQQCYKVRGAQDCKYLFIMSAPPIKDCYDISSWGNNHCLSYECCVVGENVSNVKFCQEGGINLYDAEYCNLSTGGSDHFGCVSIKKGQYCILNKRYSKNDYISLKERIIKQMNEMPYIDRGGRIYKYGEFFPIELSPQYYNETIAQKLFPLSKEKIGNQGYDWRDAEEKQYTITMTSDKLPDHIKNVSDSILQEVIGCSNCARGFKIIPMELAFLRERNLPLPRECPFCRIEEKFNRWIENLRMIKRECSQCGAEFETSYPKDEVENILCKKCYLKEVV